MGKDKGHSCVAFVYNQGILTFFIEVLVSAFKHTVNGILYSEKQEVSKDINLIM